MSTMPVSSDAECRLAEALTAAVAGELKVAAGIWRELLGREPYLLEAQQNLALALFKLREYGEAFQHLECACRLFPRDPTLALWHGHVMQKLGNTEQAAADYTTAVALEPDNASTWMVLAMARRDLADYPSACDAIQQYLRLNPHDPQGHFEYAQLLLGLGRCEQGFAEYEWRFHRTTCPLRDYPHPRWDGTVRAGFRLLIYAEQGYGDTIQFVRFIPQLVREGMVITFACYPELVRLMQCLSGLCHVVELGTEPREMDANVPIMSLGLHCAAMLRENRLDLPYLSINSPPGPLLPSALSGREKRIGLVWAGSSRYNNDDVRSMEWSIFSRIMENREHRYYSLQVGGQRPAPWPEQLKDLSPLIHDYADSAALVAQLELVITVDTSVAHLTGALGLPCWLLLPFAPDWRWLLQESIGPWYQEMRIFRQTRRGDWQGVVSRVINALDGLRES